jgi:hypothetical protein
MDNFFPNKESREEHGRVFEPAYAAKKGGFDYEEAPPITRHGTTKEVSPVVQAHKNLTDDIIRQRGRRSGRHGRRHLFYLRG